LETRIAEQLGTLTADDMQRLAEDYARLRFPDRFRRFDFRALSPEGKSRAGWPDAYVVLPDGGVDGVEATTEKNKSSIWDHLGQDVKKARDRIPKLSGFVFLSGQPAIQPSADEINVWRAKFANEAGLKLDCVDLVFGGRLAQELAGPEFARTRLEILGLSHLPAWFELVRPDAPPDSPQAEFIPSPSEYESGWVHRPVDAERILGHLEKEGRALVRGVGASGKTVLAWLLALETCHLGRPAYYLDLGRLRERITDVGSGLEEDLVCFGHPSSLFILDNVHLNERLARRLAVAWEELVIPQRPRLLLLGRELHSGRGSPIAGLDVPIVTLKARQAEVLGVYRRLVHRRTRSAAIAEPPPEVLDRWVRTFGGDPALEGTTTDLIAFSAAVLKRLPDLLSRRWSLSEADASDEIRESYLKKLSDGETHNLMRLAVLAECELFLSEDALFDRRAGFDVATRRLGLVFRAQSGGREQYVRYHFAHPALGRLFLTSGYEPVDVENEQLLIAFAHPYSGFVLAHSLMVAGLPTRARTILTALVADPGRLLEVPHLGNLLNGVRLVQQLKAAALTEIDHALADRHNRGRLVECALRTPVGDLQAFLVYADETTELKEVFDALCAELGKRENRSALLERTLLTPLHFVPSFLAYARKTDGLKAVFDALCAELGKRDNRSRLVECALLTQRHLQTFLAYAEKTDELKTVFDALCAELGKRENRSRLIERALATPLADLQGFLGYAEKTNELRAVFDALCAELGKRENRSGLVERALVTPLATLQVFLGYAERTDELKAVFDALCAELERSENRSRLIGRLATTKLGQLASILSMDTAQDLWNAVLLDVDRIEWTLIRLRIGEDDIDAFIAFQRLVTAKGLPDLASAPALALIRRSDPTVWHRPGIGLHHLSHVLRCAAGASDTEIRVFLERVATPEWIDDQVRTRASTGGLAGSLHALSKALPPDSTECFMRPCLRDRVIRELTISAPGDFGAWADCFSLLGAAADLGLRIDSVATHWPGLTDLAAILELRAPSPEWTKIGPLQIQLWLGLREMARMRETAVLVSPEYGDLVLTLWRATYDGEGDRPPSSYRREANAGMISWLESCRANGWHLVKEGG
jgi:hypothetical protein